MFGVWLFMVMVMVIYSALVRSHQSTSLVASASCVPRGYNTRARLCLNQNRWRGSPLREVESTSLSSPDLQGWDPIVVHFFVGTSYRLGILSTCLQTLRPCCPACGTPGSENRFVNFDRRVELSLRKYHNFSGCLSRFPSCLIRQYLPYGPTTSKHGACWFFSCLHIITNTAQLIRMASKARLSF